MSDKLWHRVGPGDDVMVDRFLAASVRRLERRLDAANGWHRAGRRYTLTPPLPRPGSPQAYELTDVTLDRATPTRLPWLAIVIFSIPNLILIASTLIDILR